MHWDITNDLLGGHRSCPSQPFDTTNAKKIIKGKLGHRGHIWDSKAVHRGVSINVRTLPCGFRFAMSGTLPPILLKSSMENSTSDLSNKTNIISCAIDTKSNVRLSRRRETRIRAHLHDKKSGANIKSNTCKLILLFLVTGKSSNHTYHSITVVPRGYRTFVLCTCQCVPSWLAN